MAVEALVEHEPQMQDLSELFLNLDRGPGYISPGDLLAWRKTFAAEQAEDRLAQLEADELQQRVAEIAANQAQADLAVSPARKKLDDIKREVIAAHPPLTIPQQVVGAAIELTPVFVQVVKDAAGSTLTTVSGGLKSLEERGAARDYTAQSEKEPIIIDSRRAKAGLAAAATIASVLHGLQSDKAGNMNSSTQRQNIVASSIFGAEHKGLEVTKAPILRLASNKTDLASPAHLAAQQHPGSENHPVTNGAARTHLIQEGRNYAKALMSDAVNQAQKISKEPSKLSLQVDRDLASEVDRFAQNKINAYVLNPAVTLTPAAMASAAQQLANVQTAIRFPNTVGLSAPNSDPAIKALSGKLFSGTDSYSIEEQAAVSGAILSAAETFMSPEDYAAYLQSLADDSAPALPAPTAQPTPTEQAPAAAGETLHLNTEHYHGMAWTQEDFAKIQENMSVYQEAAKAYDLPWEMIAVLHKREHNLAVSNPGNGQGIYQFYNEAGQYAPGPVSTAEFLRQTKLVAQRLRTDYANRGMQDVALSAESVDAQKLMDTFGRYNGRAALYVQQANDAGYSARQWFMGSPYVVNLMSDAQNSDKNPDWKQYLADGSHVGPANHQVGAFVAFKELAEIAGDGDKLVNQIQLLPQAGHEARQRLQEKLDAAQAVVDNLMKLGSPDQYPAGPERVVAVAIAEQRKNITETPIGCDQGNTSAVGSCGPEIDKYTDGHLEYWCMDAVQWIRKAGGMPVSAQTDSGRAPSVSVARRNFENGHDGSFITDPNQAESGDLIFFPEHVGLVLGSTDDYLITFQGNTSANDFSSNGTVAKIKLVSKNSSRIVGFGHTLTPAS